MDFVDGWIDKHGSRRSKDQQVDAQMNKQQLWVKGRTHRQKDQQVVSWGCSLGLQIPKCSSCCWHQPPLWNHHELLCCCSSSSLLVCLVFVSTSCFTFPCGVHWVVLPLLPQGSRKPSSLALSFVLLCLPPPTNNSCSPVTSHHSLISVNIATKQTAWTDTFPFSSPPFPPCKSVMN